MAIFKRFSINTVKEEFHLLRKVNYWLANHYGSRRGFVRTYWHRLRYYFGAYHVYSNIDWQSVERLVFVCKGNICRSAYAEVVARSLGIEAVSCGLDTIEHSRANESAMRAAKRSGFNLDEHRTRPVMYLDLKKTDLLVAMEPWQAEYLDKHLMREHVCTLLGLWTRPRLPHLQDPYSAVDTYFDNCFTSIRSGVSAIVSKVSK